MIEANLKRTMLKKNRTTFFCASEDMSLANDRAGERVHPKTKKYNISVEKSHSRFLKTLRFMKLPRALPPGILQGPLTTTPRPPAGFLEPVNSILFHKNGG